jgi:dephospho-CoA kinase
MGKTTTAGLFAEVGTPVYDADAVIHQLYARGGAAVAPVGSAFPDAVVDGAVDRRRLSALVLGAPEKLRHLESITHPLVFADRAGFLKAARASGAPVAVIDVPLLFETGGERLTHAVAVVSAPGEIQSARVLARPGMTTASLEAILARQTPDAEKRRRADFVIDTGHGLEPAREAVRRILHTLSDRNWRSAHPDRLDAGAEHPQN